MDREEQVTNLKLSKKLKKLEVEQDSLWYYETYDNKGYSIKMDGQEFMNHDDFSGSVWHKDGDCISAFTVAELGEKLPYTYLNKVEKDEVGKFIWETDEHAGLESTEADARAKMLICLIDEGLIEI